MKLIELESLLAGEPVFETSLLLSGRDDAASIRRQLARWVKSNRIVRLRRGLYSFVRPGIESPHSFLVANNLKRPSYVSLQSALSYYGLIPESAPVVTSVTTLRPEDLDTPIGRYQFRHIKPQAFFGYELKQLSHSQWAFVAAPEKALVDLLYLLPNSDDKNLLSELRFHASAEFSWSRLRAFVDRLRSKKVKAAVDKLGDLMELEGYREL